MTVYEAIQNVMRDIGQHGISKGRKNQQQGYQFRGIDDVYNELNPIMVKHGLLMLPRVMASEQVERMTAKGNPIFYTRLSVEFDFVSASDGTKHTIATVGEAMDSADKSSNKAMAAAYKYAAMMAFCIPTEGDNDADATTHDVAAKPKSSASLKRDDAWGKVKTQVENDFLDVNSVVSLDKLWSEMTQDPDVKAWPVAWKHALKDLFDAKRETLEAAVEDTPTPVDYMAAG